MNACHVFLVTIIGGMVPLMMKTTQPKRCKGTNAFFTFSYSGLVILKYSSYGLICGIITDHTLNKMIIESIHVFYQLFHGNVSPLPCGINADFEHTIQAHTVVGEVIRAQGNDCSNSLAVPGLAASIIQLFYTL